MVHSSWFMASKISNFEIRISKMLGHRSSGAGREMMEGGAKLGKEEFVVRAIKKLRGRYRGIHSVFSGFNEAFREYFGEDPRPVTQELAARGIIAIRPVKGGVMLYLKGEAPHAGDDALRKILDDKEG
jgi:hypothetical protein